LNLADEVHTQDERDLFDSIDRFETNLLVVGPVEGERALGVAPGLPAALLARPRVDWVVVEADGSRMLPAKAPADHEPVIPPETSLLVPVAGIDALDAPIEEITHRPERVSDITGLSSDRVLTPDALARLLTSPRGGLKRVPEGARVALLINKVETAVEYAAARRVAECALKSPRVERVVLGALKSSEPAPWEIWRRRS
jgi:molybdenum cofactor cytidylyltransferase